MSEALIVRDERAVTISGEQMDLIKKTIAPDATPAELQLFIYDNTRRGVHPLDKMIHFTKRGGKYTPVTGIDFMRTRAAETGDYAGSDDAVFDGNDGSYPGWARVTVHRFVQGQRCPFTATARWSEYYPGDGPSGMMWRKMPHTMLAKCAEALALRKGFPQQIAGLYAAEEMAQAPEDQRPVVIEPHESRPNNPPYLPNAFAPKPTPAPVVAPVDTIPFDDAPEESHEPPEGFVYVKDVTERSGKTSAGKDWTLYIVKFSDGREASTFDGPLSVSAKAALASHIPVIPTLQAPGKGNGKFNLVSLIRA